MQAILAKMDLDDALLGFDKMPSSWTTDEKQYRDRKALSQIHLHLSNQILYDVLKEKIVNVLWLKLEQDLGLIRLYLLRSSYTTFRNTILYSRDILTLDEVYDTLYSKEKMKQLVVGFEAQGEGLVV